MTVSESAEEIMALKAEIEILKRVSEVDWTKCLKFSLDVYDERVKAQDLICGQNELIRQLRAKIGFLETILASEREVYWKVASELELLKFQEIMRKMRLWM